MGRKVSVGLEADVAGFLRPVMEATKATEKLDDKIEDLDDSLNKIPADAAKAGLAMKLLGGDVDSVDGKIGSIGEKNTGLAVLDAKVREAQKEVRKLGDEFVRTGDIDVFNKLGDAEAKLRGLRDARKTLADSVVEGAKEADTALKKLGDTADGTSKKITALSNPSGSAALTVLDSRIKSWQQEVRKLGDEFTRTGNIDVFRKLGDAEARLAGLKDIRKHLTAALTDGIGDAGKIIADLLSKNGSRAADGFWKTFTSTLAGFLGTPILGPILIGLAATVAVPLASFIGGAIGGALALVSAGAGAGLGLAGAWMGDPDKYQSMWNKAIDGIQGRWKASSAAFGNELEESLKVVDRTLRGLPVEKILALSQSFVMPLVSGAGAGLTALADGFADALERAQPVVEKFGPELANLGQDAGDAFRMIAQGSEGGAQALGDLTNAIGYTVKATGLLILGFEKSYEKIRDFESANFKFVSSVPIVGDVANKAANALFYIASGGTAAGKALADTGDAAYASSTGIGSWVASAAEAQASAMALNDALAKTHNQMLALADANVGVAQGWLDLNEGLKDGKRTLDLSTQAGIDNQKVIISQIGLLEQQREQAIATSDGSVEASDRANAAYAAQVEQIRKAAYAAGFDKGEVDKLIASLGAVPPTTKADVKVSGLSTSLDQGISLGNALNRIDGRTYSASIRISGIADAARAAAIAGGASHAAGGTMPFSGPKLVGELGPEFVWGNEGEYVSTAQQTTNLRAAMSTGTSGGGGGGGRPASIGVMLYGGDAYTASLIKDLRAEVRTSYGGDVQVAMGS